MNKETKIVKTQRMFPNCEKYTICCDEGHIEFWDKASPSLAKNATKGMRITKTDKMLSKEHIPSDFNEPQQKPWDGK